MSFPNRTMCEALREMRECYKTYNFAPIAGLIEEVQSMGNRMEAALSDKHDLGSARKRYKELKKEIVKLEREVEKLRGKEKVKVRFTSYPEVVGRDKSRD